MPTSPPARHRRLRHISDQEAGLNLTPLIDIIFILMFFFFMATEVRHDLPNVQVDLPDVTEAGKSATLPDEQRTIITITESGEIFLDRDEQPTAREGLADALRERHPPERGGSVVIRGDGDARMGPMVEVMAQCQSAGYSKVRILVDEGAKSGSAGGAPRR